MQGFRRTSFLVLLLWIAFLSLVSTYSCFNSIAQSSDWETIKPLYDSHLYVEAIQKLKEHPNEDSGYYYNLGTLYYKTGQLGAAVAYLEKSNRLNPHDPDTQHNLSMARAELAGSIGADSLDLASTSIEQLADRISLEEVRATLGLIGLIVLIFWTRAYLKTRQFRKVLAQTSGILGLAAFVITLGVYKIQRWAAATPAAVCLESQSIRSGPGPHFLELGQTHAGIKVRVLGSAPQASLASLNNPALEGSAHPEIWQQVRYSSDGIGWIKASGLLLL